MDSDGGFHEVETDCKLVKLVYHHPKYNPIPQTQSLTLCGEADHPPQPFFLCPVIRLRKDPSLSNEISFLLNVSPEYVSSTTTTTQQDGRLIDHDEVDDHLVLPLFWCNNKEFYFSGGCVFCEGLNFGRDYYFCGHCNMMFHKECVESPLKIKHPYQPDHALQLYVLNPDSGDTSIECLGCRRGARYLVYYSDIGQSVMHPLCAMKPVPFVIDQPKRHDHPLTFFPRQTSLVCNVCGLLRKNYPTYVCLRCNFVAHNDCMYSPSIIKISRHHHRISYISSLPSGEWVCGVCRQRIDGNYGAYICDKCGDYLITVVSFYSV